MYIIATACLQLFDMLNPNCKTTPTSKTELALSLYFNNIANFPCGIVQFYAFALNLVNKFWFWFLEKVQRICIDFLYNSFIFLGDSILRNKPD